MASNIASWVSNIGNIVYWPEPDNHTSKQMLLKHCFFSLICLPTVGVEVYNLRNLNVTKIYSSIVVLAAVSVSDTDDSVFLEGWMQIRWDAQYLSMY